MGSDTIFSHEAERHGLTIHAYVWMTNHVHLLATPEFEDSKKMGSDTIFFLD